MSFIFIPVVSLSDNFKTESKNSWKYTIRRFRLLPPTVIQRQWDDRHFQGKTNQKTGDLRPRIKVYWVFWIICHQEHIGYNLNLQNFFYISISTERREEQVKIALARYRWHGAEITSIESKKSVPQHGSQKALEFSILPPTHSADAPQNLIYVYLS
jgi:hypothetical protein